MTEQLTNWCHIHTAEDPFHDEVHKILAHVHRESARPDLWFPANRGGLLYAASRVGAAVVFS